MKEGKVKRLLDSLRDKTVSAREKLSLIWHTRDERTLRRCVAICTAIFSLLLIWVVFFKFGISSMIYRNYVNLSQFDLKGRFLYDIIPFNLHNINIKNQIMDILCNCLLFAPYGALFCELFKKKSILRDLAICFLISLVIEVVQLFTMLGGFATIDLITNTISYFVGYLIYRFLLTRMNTESRVCFYRVINLIMLPILVYAAYTFVDNFELIMAVLTRSI